jgi:hypothetical protein
MPMTTAETDRRVDEARESMVARIEELGRRLHNARERLDVQRYIVAHPLIAVGAAFALGAVLGFVGGGKRGKSADKRGLGGTLAAAVGTLVMAGLKEIAVHQIRRQFEGGRDREAEASSEPELESFFKH